MAGLSLGEGAGQKKAGRGPGLMETGTVEDFRRWWD